MKATLTFEDRQSAEDFALAWSRRTGKGHTIHSGTENVMVDIYDVGYRDTEWINNIKNR